MWANGSMMSLISLRHRLQVVSLTSGHATPGERNRYVSNRRPGRSQSQPGRSGQWNIYCFCRDSNHGISVVHPVAWSLHRQHLLTYLLTYLLHGAESFLKSQPVLQLVKKFPAFLEPEGSSPYSQVPATCPYPEPTPSSPHNPLPLPEDPS